jgi:hypothetical protein
MDKHSSLLHTYTDASVKVSHIVSTCHFQASPMFVGYAGANQSGALTILHFKNNYLVLHVKIRLCQRKTL